MQRDAFSSVHVHAPQFSGVDSMQAEAERPFEEGGYEGTVGAVCTLATAASTTGCCGVGV